jgi:hypothetical protein
MATYTTDTGLVLDEDDPDDAKILKRQRAVARKAGVAGDDRATTTRGRADLERAYDEGAAATAASSAPASPVSPAPTPGKSAAGKPAAGRGGRGGGRASMPAPTLTPPKSLTSGRDLSGFALGLVLYALSVAYLRYGPSGPKSWMKAKFLNKPMQGDDLERDNRKDENNGVDPAPSGRGPHGEKPAEGHLDPNDTII